MKRIEAIRKDKRVGRGSCAYIDECWTDKQILELLEDKGITTPQGAVEWAHDMEGLTRDHGASHTSGEEDCPLVESARAWREEPCQ